jgi:TAG lipase/steryl ester hydrolase/phospholipase A2/LPA acyltransferase
LTTPHTPSSPSNGEILEALIQTRQAYGGTALLLSGGATFGMMHIGVIRALFETDLLPRIISGASAGSIVASVLCTKTDDEIPYCLENFASGDLAVFDDEQNPDTILRRVARFLKVGAWIDIKHLIRVMRCLLGDMTFQEAYYRTQRVLNICVSSAR